MDRLSYAVESVVVLAAVLEQAQNHSVLAADRPVDQ